MRLIKQFLLLVILLFCFSGLKAEPKSYYFNAGKPKVTFPFKVFNNILVVEVKMNTNDTLRFIFDSGCKSTIIIHPKWLNKFEVPYMQKVYFVGLGYKDSIETMKIDNGTFELNKLKAEHIPIYILAKDSMILDYYLGTNVDGIFGAEIFENFYVHINYRKNLIELYNKRPSKKIKSSYIKIPVDIRKSKGYLSCMVMNNKNELFLSEFLLDTGSNIPIIIKNKEPEDLNIDYYIEAEIGEGLSGTMYSLVSRIKKIFIDTLKFDNVVTAFNETPITFKEMNENTLDGNIGNEILSRLDIYYAFPDSCIYVKPTSKVNDPFYYNISNIILLEEKTRNGGYIVKSIASNSPPLLAGLQVGDEILRIDGMHCDKMKFENALLLLNKRIGRKISIHFRRNNEMQKITYKLISII